MVNRAKPFCSYCWRHLDAKAEETTIVLRWSGQVRFIHLLGVKFSVCEYSCVTIIGIRGIGSWLAKFRLRDYIGYYV